MFSDAIYFYIFSGLLIASSAAVIFAPRLFISAIALFFSFLFTGLLCLKLNTVFIALLEFIIWGFILCPVIFILIKKISQPNLHLKLAGPAKMIFSFLVLGAFFFTVALFFKEEFANSLLNIFNYINQKSPGTFDFSEYLFPGHLLLILILITIIVIRAVTKSVEEEEEAQND